MMTLLLGYLVKVLPIAAIISYVLYLPVFLIKRKEYGKRPFIRHFVIIIFIVVVLSILYATFGTVIYDGLTFNPEHHNLNLKPFAWIQYMQKIGIAETEKQTITNFVMFMPLGFIIPVVFNNLRKWWKTALCIMTFILIIETLQYVIGRSADIDDLIFNTTGALVGYGVFAIINIIFENKTYWEKAINLTMHN